MGIKRAKPLGWRQGTVLGWAGMRGVVTLAVPLTLPIDMPGRDLMLVCAFAVIFVTVVVQGSSLNWVIRKVAPGRQGTSRQDGHGGDGSRDGACAYDQNRGTRL